METSWKKYEAMPENYYSIRDDVVKSAKNAGISDAKLIKLELGLEEIVVNVISYAYDSAHRPILVKYYISGDRFIIEIVDYGKKFNPLEAPQRTNPPSLNQRPGGYGIFLVKKFFTSVTYEYEEIEGFPANHLTMELTIR